MTEPISVCPARRVGLRTDASGKFEKGLDPNNAQAAIDRACQLIEELGAGDVVGGMVDVYPVKREPVRFPLSQTRSKHSWEPRSARRDAGYFKKIELEYDEKTNESRSSDLPSGSVPSLQIWQRKWQVSSDMTIFRLRFRQERQPPASFLIS